MKKHISVLILYVRSALPGLLCIMAIMAVVQVVSFHYMDLKTASHFAEEMMELRFSFIVGCCAVYCVCLGNGEKHSKFHYTIQRLRISERAVFEWNWLANSLCFLAVWLWEIVIVFFLAKWYAAGPAYHGGPQGILISFYRSEFLHGLFPLESLGVWIRNLIYVFTAGAACAYGSLLMRMEKKQFMSLVVPVFLMNAQGSQVDMFYWVTGMLSGFMCFYCLAAGLLRCHNGKGAYADESE